MSGSRLMLGFSLGALVLAACINPTPGPRRPLEDEVMRVTTEQAGGSQHVHVQARRADGSAVDLAVLRGVRLKISGQQEKVLPFAHLAKEPHAIVARCEPHANHEVTVRFEHVSRGVLVVSLQDEVALRNALLELTLDYDIRTLASPDQVHAPHMQDGLDHVIGDEAFRCPLVLVRRGKLGLALLPQLLSDRRLPQAIELDTEPPYRLRHGLVSHRTQERGGCTSFTRQAAPPVEVQGETLRFGHELRVINDASPKTKGQLLRLLWDRHARPALADSTEPLPGKSLLGLTEAALLNVSRNWQPIKVAGWQGGLFTPTVPEAGAQVARFEFLNQAVRDAWAVARGARWIPGGDERIAIQRVKAVVELVLRAPRRAGLLPSRLHIVASSKQELRWFVVDEARGPASFFHAGHVASTWTWLLRLQAEIGDPVLAQRVVTACEQPARFMMSNQTKEGDLPGYYGEGYFAPLQDHRLSVSTELGTIALFLIEYAEATGDAAPRIAARKALRLLRDRNIQQGRWVDSESIFAGSKLQARDLRSGQWRQGVLGLVKASLAALRLHETEKDKESGDLALHLLHELMAFQQVWQPPWHHPRDVVGGSGTHNGTIAWNDERQALMAQAFLEGYDLLEEPQLLERGMAALRAAFVVDAMSPTAACVAVRAHNRLGDAVVDAERSFAHGIASVWFEDLKVQRADVSFRILTHSPGDPRLRVKFRNLPREGDVSVTANGVTLGRFTVEQLEAGIEVRARLVPQIKFAPPPQLRHDGPWLPRATLVGRMDEGSVAHVEIYQDRLLRARIPLDLEDNRLVGRDPFVPGDSTTPGDQVEVRLVYETADGHRLLRPRQGARTLSIGRYDCIDPGEGDEVALTKDEGSSVVRFPNGKEDARRAVGASRFTYEVPVSPEATGLELQLRVFGRVRIQCRDRLLHEDGPRTPMVVRELRLSLTDRRLWPGGLIPLSFAPAEHGGGSAMMLALVRYRESGKTVLDPVIGRTNTGREPDQQLLLHVQPVNLTDRRVAGGEEALRQAFFGGAGYRRTPAPNPKATAGSLARVLRELSGGRTDVEGKILKPVNWNLTAAELHRIELAKQHPTTGSGEQPHVLVFIVGGHVEKLPTQKDLRGMPVVFLSERHADQSFLSTGEALGAVLRTRYRLEQLGTSKNGRFGDLALLAGKAMHLPAPLTGRNMARIGWSDLVDLEQRDYRTVELAPLETSRTSYRLEHTVPGRGRLFLDGQRPAELEGQTGALVYWELPAQPPIYFRSRSGAVTRPRFVRLSPDKTILETPFEDGSSRDLFVRASRVSTTTPQGETLWEMRQLRPTSAKTIELDLLYRVQDLISGAPRRPQDRFWSTAGPERRAAPLAADGEQRIVGMVRPLDKGFLIQPRLRPGGRVILNLQVPSGTLRMFGRMRQMRGNLDLEIRQGARLLLRQGLGADGKHLFQIDLPAAADSTAYSLDFVQRGDGQSSAVLDQLLLAPRSRSTIRPRLPRAKTASGRLMNGISYAERPILRGGRDAAEHRTPVILPKGPSLLRILAGLPFACNDNQGGLLRVEVRDQTGKKRHVLLDDLKLRRKRGADGSQSAFLGLLEVPEEHEGRLVFLTLRWQGDVDLHLPTLEFDRP